MEILLAGYNLDYNLIREMKDKSGLKQDLTPETISAAYARISRSPKPVNDLREISREEVDKARQSNRNIVFEMGHSSVAEHAVFNIDVIGVSRLLVEEIEKFRLCSYTEKSQRYVLFNKDFVVPDEIRRANLTNVFVSTIEAQNDYYHALYEKLRPYIFEKHKALAGNPANKAMLEGWAKEDARYAISMATQTQLGMTINARNLELMLRRLAASSLAEANEYSQKLYAATKEIAPSLIRYTQATDYDKFTRKNLRGLCADLSEQYGTGFEKLSDVQLIYSSPDADNRIAATLLFSSSNMTYARCLSMAGKMTSPAQKALFKTAFENIKLHDAVLREMENVDLIFELVLSSSCFAQLKRHRMSTIIAQEYDPQLGVTVPPSIKAIGEQKAFMDVMRRTQKAYKQISEKTPHVASYVLTNAHRKRVLMKFNAREMYHLARLRADAHAQWDIRNLTEKMLRQARKVMPHTLMMACGKDNFPKLFLKTFSGK
ncbi:MAG TPA: FAD-dependent thymidylate synthase [Smithella sp.]|nr:FAD-dependent thymidylate synthase [Smithella sp.]HQO14543.1 FAD-dependent thymidylate synthase [Smithellaceae bacterium]HNY49954.1 FAD-dependent thymidylate synthase [Smithella sp.]HOG90482.1 FAD-dependent thymidylate synthase [Smithella sp.]HOU51645.1 FAD-dependent thymidylate synthase [Smithella sp.]